jgi:hypothetical protein
MRRLRFEALEGRMVLSVAPGVSALAHSVVAQAASLHSTITPVATESSNWSGYAVTGTSVSYVAGSWLVPTVSTTTSGYTSVWVGIDGFSSSTVEQIGTDSDYVSGRVSYYAWYEMYPSGSYNISMTVKPNDAMTASVTYQGSNSFLLSIADTTEGETFSKAFSMSGAARSSAEWIVEAPSSYSGVLPLSNFGSVTFTNAYATVNGTTGAIDNFKSYSINLVTGSQVNASTGPLSDSTPVNPVPTGTSSTYPGPVSKFTVTYEAVTTGTGTGSHHHGRGGSSSGGSGSDPGPGSGGGWGVGSSWGWNW